MIRRLAVGIILLGLASAGRSQSAHYFSGQDLHEMVNAYNRVDRQETAEVTDFPAYARFIGYVSGVSDTAVTEGLICPPYGTTADQATAIVAKYVTDNPGKWGKTGDWIVINALARVFPCPKR